jgi:hypothetical protein
VPIPIVAPASAVVPAVLVAPVIDQAWATEVAAADASIVSVSQRILDNRAANEAQDGEVE